MQEEATGVIGDSYIDDAQEPPASDVDDFNAEPEILIRGGGLTSGCSQSAPGLSVLLMCLLLIVTRRPPKDLRQVITPHPFDPAF